MTGFSGIACCNLGEIWRSGRYAPVMAGKFGRLG
jgi:hypothetical protein